MGAIALVVARQFRHELEENFIICKQLVHLGVAAQDSGLGSGSHHVKHLMCEGKFADWFRLAGVREITHAIEIWLNGVNREFVFSDDVVGHVCSPVRPDTLLGYFPAGNIDRGEAPSTVEQAQAGKCGCPRETALLRAGT